MKQKPEAREPHKATSEYYKLHSEAVEDLVTANKENSPKVPASELKKYRSGTGLHIPENIRLLFIKFWFPAAVCYFFLWGLGNAVPFMMDRLFITGIAMGIVTDVLTNNALRFFAATKGANDRYMMFPKKGYITYPLNILYAFVVLALVFTLYNILNIALLRLTGAPEDSVPLGVEPVLFGLFYLMFDSLLIGAKHLFLKILSDAKESAGGSGRKS